MLRLLIEQGDTSKNRGDAVMVLNVIKSGCYAHTKELALWCLRLLFSISQELHAS